MKAYGSKFSSSPSRSPSSKATTSRSASLLSASPPLHAGTAPMRPGACGWGGRAGSRSSRLSGGMACLGHRPPGRSLRCPALQDVCKGLTPALCARCAGGAARAPPQHPVQGRALGRQRAQRTAVQAGVGGHAGRLSAALARVCGARGARLAGHAVRAQLQHQRLLRLLGRGLQRGTREPRGMRARQRAASGSRVRLLRRPGALPLAGTCRPCLAERGVARRAWSGACVRQATPRTCKGSGGAGGRVFSASSALSDVLLGLFCRSEGVAGPGAGRSCRAAAD